MYFFVLITHIVLAAVVVPMILLSFFTSLSGRLAAHRRLSRFTFPVWLYVSVTGRAGVRDAEAVFELRMMQPRREKKDTKNWN